MRLPTSVPADQTGQKPAGHDDILHYIGFHRRTSLPVYVLTPIFVAMIFWQKKRKCCSAGVGGESSTSKQA
jgi:hypothetical protein